MVLIVSIKVGKELTRSEDLDGSRLARDTGDEVHLLEPGEHLVHRGWCDLEVALDVCLRWSAAKELGVVVDERQILPLFRGECWHG